VLAAASGGLGTEGAEGGGATLTGRGAIGGGGAVLAAGAGEGDETDEDAPPLTGLGGAGGLASGGAIGRGGALGSGALAAGGGGVTGRGVSTGGFARFDNLLDSFFGASTPELDPRLGREGRLIRTVSFLTGTTEDSATLGRAGNVILTVSFFGSLSLIRKCQNAV
jgi:hypothetical protein